MKAKARLGNVSQQAAGYYTFRFAGLFNLPIPIRYAFAIGVSLPPLCGIIRPASFSTLCF